MRGLTPEMTPEKDCIILSWINVKWKFMQARLASGKKTTETLMKKYGVFSAGEAAEV